MTACARPECQVEFTPKTHNQKYCGAECCSIETNRRIMERYYTRRDQRMGKVRWCGSCTTTQLSRYNDSNICGACQRREQEDSRASVLNMVATFAS